MPGWDNALWGAHGAGAHVGLCGLAQLAFFGHAGILGNVCYTGNFPQSRFSSLISATWYGFNCNSRQTALRCAGAARIILRSASWTLTKAAPIFSQSRNHRDFAVQLKTICCYQESEISSHDSPEQINEWVCCSKAEVSVQKNQNKQQKTPNRGFEEKPQVF